MAIIKPLDSNFGVSVAYHRITAININLKTKTIILCVSSYLSKEARQNNKISLEDVDIEIPKNDFHLFTGENIMATCYDWLKANVVGFEDSEDCYDSFSESLDTTVNEEDVNTEGDDTDEEDLQ
jgi:hypothetical protein